MIDNILPTNFYRLAFGNECGIAIIDLIQRTVLLNMGTPDLYGQQLIILQISLLGRRSKFHYSWITKMDATSTIFNLPTYD